MARNYTIAEAAQIIAENRDLEALADMGKRYPLLTQKMARVAVKAGEDFVDFMSYMPEYISANKINSSIKKMLDEAPEVEDDEEVEEKPVKKSTGKKGRPAKAKPEPEEVEDDDDVEDEEESGTYDYDSMNNAKLYKLLGELGKRKDCKEKYGDLSKASMLKYLKKYGPKSGASAEPDDDEEEVSEDSYEGKSAVELYKLCKQRKIKAEQKKPAKYYVALLKKADEEAEAELDDAEDEDWGDDDADEEEVETKKAAKTKKEKAAPAKSTKKPAKKPEPEEVEDDADDDDDDEEWDI